MTIFHDIRLPEEIEQGSHWGPGFKTTILDMSSGAEQRNQDWSAARGKGDISYGIDGPAEFSLVQAFFYARAGRAFGWRFRDWTDYQLNLEPIGTADGSAQAAGDGTTTTFQIIKTYEATGPAPYTRRITRPVSTTTFAYVNGALTTLANTILIYVNGVLETHWSLSGTNLVVFAAGHVPPMSATITVSCDFDVPVRFDVDELSAVMNLATAASIDHLPIVELRE